MAGKKPQPKAPALRDYLSRMEPAMMRPSLSGTLMNGFEICIRLSRMEEDEAPGFVKLLNTGLKERIKETENEHPAKAKFRLQFNDTQRNRLCSASFKTFEDAKGCMKLLRGLKLDTHGISQELEASGREYDAYLHQPKWRWLTFRGVPRPRYGVPNYHPEPIIDPRVGNVKTSDGSTVQVSDRAYGGSLEEHDDLPKKGRKKRYRLDGDSPNDEENPGQKRSGWAL